jgi:uncharacterized membrane protein HdeD (DUF308 family)
MNQKTQWVQNPTKTQFIIILTAYIISIIVGVAAMTDFFREPFDLKVNIVLLFLYIAVTFSMIKVVRNYYKTPK